MKKKKQPEMSPALAKLVEGFSKLSTDERQEAANIGIVIPMASAGGSVLEEKFGYRCRKCGELALTFLGTKFLDGEGNEIQTPPTNVACAKVPWIQRMKRGESIRHSPNCQNCNQSVVLHAGLYFHANRMVEIATWESSRARAKSNPSKKKLRGSVPGLDSKWVAPSSIGELMDDGTKQRINDLAEQHDLDSISVDV